MFSPTGLDAILVDYLYNQVPEGKRRDQMKRLMLLGLMQELGIKSDREHFIPPRPIELTTPPLSSTLDERFIGRSTSTDAFKDRQSRLLGNIDDVERGDVDYNNDRVATLTDVVGRSNNGDDRRDERITSPSVDDKPVNESSSDIVNGISVSALMGFKG